MTASNRLSFLTAREASFGSGAGTNSWIAPPPGSYISTAHNRETTRVNAAGTKKWGTIAYGKVSGSWTWNFMLDYKYLEPLWYVFEDYDYASGTGGAYAEHSFKKKNGRRVPSFTIRRVILNKMAGGPEGSDEIVELLGCVCRNITFSKSAGQSQIAVTMTGFYADERMVKAKLESTDYVEYDGRIAEYMCMFMGLPGDADGTDFPDILNEDHYVAFTDSLSVQIGNSADPIYNTCSPIAANYYEGLTNNEFTTSCYSTDPAKYKQRVYSGGEVNTADHPLRKGLRPVRKIALASYDKSMVDDGQHSIGDAITASDYKIRFKITDCVIKSLTWPKADASVIQDNISSAACKDIAIEIVSDASDMESSFSDNHVTVITYNLLDANGGTLVTGSEGFALKTGENTLKTLGGESAVKIPEDRSGYNFNGYYTDTSNSGIKLLERDGNTRNLKLVAYSAGTNQDYIDTNGKWKRTSTVKLYAKWVPVTQTPAPTE